MYGPHTTAVVRTRQAHFRLTHHRPLPQKSETCIADPLVTPSITSQTPHRPYSDSGKATLFGTGFLAMLSYTTMEDGHTIVARHHS
jgi:hypothetical protein